jgi:hypothetical protein
VRSVARTAYISRVLRCCVVEPHTEGCWEHENAYMDSSSMYLRCINIALTFGLRVSPYGVAFIPHHIR